MNEFTAVNEKQTKNNLPLKSQNTHSKKTVYFVANILALNLEQKVREDQMCSRSESQTRLLCQEYICACALCIQIRDCIVVLDLYTWQWT